MEDDSSMTTSGATGDVSTRASATTIPTVAIDVMSGDGGLPVIMDAVRQVLDQRQDVHLMLVGNAAAIEANLVQTPAPAGRTTVVPSTEVVTMEDTAAVALRNKKQSSMRVAINQVKEGRASACVSAGNTGALMAISKFVLKTIPGIDRPAISTTIPAIDSHTHMLDLGANIGCTAEHLAQFATMGSILAQAVDGTGAPKVGLLNIGSEDMKGNEQVRDAAQLLNDSNLNYIGFVEGTDIFTGRVDVVVCDGFVGNVSLKTSEGVARLVSHYLKQEFKASFWNKLVGLFARPILTSFGERLDPRQYNGASLLGLQGVVVKSHGGADKVAFANAIDIALMEIALDVPTMIRSRLDNSVPVT